MRFWEEQVLLYHQKVNIYMKLLNILHGFAAEKFKVQCMLWSRVSLQISVHGNPVLPMSLPVIFSSILLIHWKMRLFVPVITDGRSSKNTWEKFCILI